MTHLPLGPGREFDRIRAITSALGAHAHGLGDDAALLTPPHATLVVSTDASVEEVHFRRDWLLPHEVGWRATAGALSDLAAIGADAIGVVVALVLPPDANDHDAALLMRGVGEATAAAGGRVLGGDLSRGPAWMVTVTVLGAAARPVSRQGAVPGAGVWVTGALGGARAALAAWLARRTPLAEARARFARPVPRLAAGRWLAQHGALAMLDISDGLAGDAQHLAAASGVALDVLLEALPVEPAAATVALHAGLHPARFAAEGGEDYELLVAMPAGFTARDARACLDATGVALTRIGTVRDGCGVRFSLGGHTVPLTGFDHFRRGSAR